MRFATLAKRQMFYCRIALVLCHVTSIAVVLDIMINFTVVPPSPIEDCSHSYAHIYTYTLFFCLVYLSLAVCVLCICVCEWVGVCVCVCVSCISTDIFPATHGGIISFPATHDGSVRASCAPSLYTVSRAPLLPSLSPQPLPLCLPCRFIEQLRKWSLV